MQARAHLKLVTSGAPHLPSEEEFHDRISMVQPLSSGRLRRHWLRAHLNVVVLWSASAVLLGVAALVALGWL
jgi:hypothetical protein